jgi:hypothetical protein
VRHIPDAERRARLGTRHHLAASMRTDDVVRLAGALAGLHSSDPASVFLAALARAKQPARGVAAVERALYDDRRVVRVLGMRRTMFVVPVDLVPVLKAGCTDALVARERKRLVGMLEEQGVARDGARWLRRVEAATVAEIERRGEATGVELGRSVPGLERKLHFGEGKTWGGDVGVTTRVLFLLATEQRVVRGRPTGGWTSSQYRWAPMDSWLPGGPVAVTPADARTELVRRYLGTFGPATTADVKWWTGWTVTTTRAALAALGAVTVSLDDGEGWVLPDDEAPRPAPEPWVALLPALDSTTMGWRQRVWYLGDLARRLFDRNGNAGPTVWADGRVVGGWAQRPDGEIALELLVDVGREAHAAVETAAASLSTQLGGTRVTPRFPTALQRDLSGRSAALP